MKALVYTDVEELTYRDVEKPRPIDDELLVEVKAVGICGSDMHAWKGHDERRPAPLILGHEVAGISSAGQRVTVNPLVTWFDCSFHKKDEARNKVLRDVLHGEAEGDCKKSPGRK